MRSRSKRLGWVLVASVWLTGAAVAAKKYCPVCDGALGGVAKQRVVGAQELLVHPECAKHFDENPDKWVGRFAPRGALFDEQMHRAAPPGMLWLYLSVYLLAGLVAGGIAAYAAFDRGRSGKLWFALGLVANVPALVALFALPRRPREFHAQGLAKIPSTRDPVPCPRCGYLNHPASDHCLGCGAALTPRVESEVAVVRREHG